MDRSTLRRIEERTNKSHFNHWKLSQKYAEHIPSPLEYLKAHLKKASGVLLWDGKYVNILGEEHCIHIAYDTILGPVDYFVDVTENKTAYGYIFARLKAIGYEVRCSVSDGHGGLVSLFDEESIPHQRCIFHLLQDLDRKLTIRGAMPHGNNVLYSRLKYIFKSSTLEVLVERVEWFRVYSAPFFHTHLQRETLQWFWEVLPNAIMHLSFEEGEVPRTNNLLENFNGQIEARLKTFRGVKSLSSLEKILKILFHFHRRK